VNAPRNSASKPLLGFAPAFDGETFDESELVSSRLRKYLIPLSYNQQEIEAIAQLMDSEVFISEQAHREKFVSQAADYRILHIASHAMLDDSDHRFSYIAFSPDSVGGPPSLLYLADLYGLDLNAEMVVLSACNTASGKLLSGEGVASLSQGFAYAGARSLVTTLWSVDDAATAQLMTYFYEGLAEKLPKDIALQRAKLRLLEEENVGPFYWAAPIAVGDMRPIRSWNWWYWVVLIGLILLVGGWMYQRHMRKVN
jgi:CHAT domain-containing protein